MTPNPDSALNEAAGKMLLEDYDGFQRHAALITRIHAGGRLKTENNDGQENQNGRKTDTALGKNPPTPASTTLNEARKKLRRL